MDFDLWLRFSTISDGHILQQLLSVALMYQEQKSTSRRGEYFAEMGLSIFRNGFIKEARKVLARPIRRTFEMDNAFSFITKNPLYRKWREAREEKMQK